MFAFESLFGLSGQRVTEGVIKMNKVVMYTTQYCPYCIAARRLLDGKGVEYQDIRVDNQPRLREEMMKKSRRQTVPQIWIGKTHVGGFDDLYALQQRGVLDGMLRDQAS